MNTKKNLKVCFLFTPNLCGGLRVTKFIFVALLPTLKNVFNFFFFVLLRWLHDNFSKGFLILDEQ